MACAAEEALVKIEAVIPETERSRIRNAKIFSPPTDITDAIRKKIDRMNIAIEAHYILSFDYCDEHGSKTTRSVRPLGLWFWGKVWTLVSWCELREDFRMFRVDRVTNLQSTGQKFIPTREHSLSQCLQQLESKYGPQH